MKIKTLLGVMGILLPLLSVKAQKIRGRITSSAGEALPHATLYLKRMATFKESDVDGRFSLYADFPDTLIISHTGYITHSVAVTSKDTILSIHLVPLSSLEEVVVSTGYQQIPKERATGSFELIDNKMLNQRISTDIISRLQGVSSVQFSTSTLGPKYMIRGITSINGPQSPLVIVDNFPYEGDINNINPNDVENISILKDAAASSIWGARAGNGVIVITTKKGRINTPLSLDINSNVSIISKPDLFYYKRMTASEEIDVEKFLFSKQYRFTYRTNSSHPAFTPVYEILFRELNGNISSADADAQINLLRNIDVRNDFDKYMYQSGSKQQYSLSVHGGNQNASYLLSTGYDKNIDVLDAGYDRYTLHSANIFRPVKALEITADINYVQSKTVSGKPDFSDFGTGNPLYPYANIADHQGNALPIAKYRTVYTDTAGGGKLLDWNYYPLTDWRHSIRNIKNQDLLTKINMNYQPFMGATVSVQYQYERQITDNNYLQDEESFYTRDLINKFTSINRQTGIITYNLPSGGILDRIHTDMEAQNIRGQIGYKKTFFDHQINTIAGMEIRTINSRVNQYRVYGYDGDVMTISKVDYVNGYKNFLNGSTSYIPFNASESQTSTHYVSTFANLLYAFRGKYRLSASARRDASNLFGVNTNDKWTPLWSTGLGWDFYKEAFYHMRWLPVLKFRLTYGFNGNVDPSRSAVTTIRYLEPASYTGYTNANFSQYANPDLRWEKFRTVNFGADFEVMHKIIYGNVDFYQKKGSDLYGESPIDPTTGVGQTITRNVASTKTNGIDLTLNSDIINRKKIGWSANLILSWNKTKVLSYYHESYYLYNYLGDIAQVGKPIYAVYSFKSAGLDNQGNPQGYINNQPSTDYSSIMYGTDLSGLKYHGSAIPVLTGAINNTFRWKTISITPCITYKFGYYFFRESINYGNLFLYHYGHSDFEKRWQNAGDENKTIVPSMVYPNSSNRDQFYGQSSVLVDKGDHVRFQYVNLDYSLPIIPSAKKTFKTLNIYLNVSNIGILWKANKDGVDPDYSSTVPPTRTYSLGIKATL